ncbi:adenylate/guanylate cyclase domain-containing protein [Mycolicibacterium mengxianglii]|uniref:adenylate/guanylate cyclase domain-containing protein n=1 Tax=Mycolicibacterium mengxianglii TaxID=2736649 RepID=UPI0027D9E830|nr:adenylate/guanylate cyclase domain-containing protein [Mycolicibacterium mengxianglii]
MTRLAFRYAAGVTVAHILAVTEVLLIMTALRPETTGASQALFRDSNAVVIVLVVVAALLTVAAGSVVNVTPALRWFVPGLEPTARQRRSAIGIARRQSLLLLAVWVTSGVITVVADPAHAPAIAVLIGPAVFFGATAAVCTALLLTMRTLRPITAAAAPALNSRDTAPGVLARLITMWVLCCALPNVGIALLIVARSHGVAITRSASIEIPVLVLSAVAVLWGLRAIILVSRSIADPIRDVVDAMAEVERGDIGRTVEVYERSEIGRLQGGFNRMVAGLRERDRLRDLFSRHVGADVVTLLVQRDRSLYRDVRDVAVLFVDLAGSTQLAATRPPQEVADILNGFFQTVVAAVDQRHGFINKFQGDAALAVFGAPLHNASAAADALATARDLADRMRRLPEVDFGIGVSAGPVFAGYLGALNRFEYTVVGDPVNEAARLADRAKSLPGRVACSGAALARAEDEERHWRTETSEVLRGRADATEISVPVAR